VSEMEEFQSGDLMPWQEMTAKLKQLERSIVPEEVNVWEAIKDLRITSMADRKVIDNLEAQVLWLVDMRSQDFENFTRSFKVLYQRISTLEAQVKTLQDCMVGLNMSMTDLQDAQAEILGRFLEGQEEERIVAVYEEC
jgi:hypothetical protein